MADPRQTSRSTYCARGLTRYLQSAWRPLSPNPTQPDPAPNTEHDATDSVFPSPRGNRPITAHALAVAMARMAKHLYSEPGQQHTLARQSAAETSRRRFPTPHDLRRTAATGMRSIGIPAAVVKSVLNHTPTDVLGRHYDHYDPMTEKRRALEKWADELKRLTCGNPDVDEDKLP